jgi:hypothetical protein
LSGKDRRTKDVNTLNVVVFFIIAFPAQEFELLDGEGQVCDAQEELDMIQSC